MKIETSSTESQPHEDNPTQPLNHDEITQNNEPLTTPTNETPRKTRRSSNRNNTLKYYSNPIPEHVPYIPFILPLQEEILCEISRTFKAFHNKNLTFSDSIKEDRVLLSSCVLNLDKKILPEGNINVDDLRNIFGIIAKKYISQIKQNLAKHFGLKPKNPKSRYALIPDHEKYDTYSEAYISYRNAMKNPSSYCKKLVPFDFSEAVPGL